MTIHDPLKMFDVKGKVALITGVSGAFGMVAARVLAGAGCKLALAAGSQDALAETQISAPFDGEIAEVLVEEGEFIGAGSPAFRLVSVDNQLGIFSVPPRDAQSLLDNAEIYLRSETR